MVGLKIMRCLRCSGVEDNVGSLERCGEHNAGTWSGELKIMQIILSDGVEDNASALKAVVEDNSEAIERWWKTTAINVRAKLKYSRFVRNTMMKE